MSRAAIVVEKLESRLQLSGGAGTAPAKLPDALHQAMVSLATSLPAALIAGRKAGATAVVKVKNNDTGPSAGPVTVRLFASTDQTAAGATPLASVRKKLQLKRGQTKTIRIKLPGLPPALPPGTYYVVAELTDSAGDDVVAASPGTVTVAPPFVDLAGSLSILSQGVTAATVRNAGNIRAAGPLTIAFSAEPIDGTSALPLASVKKTIRLKPGAAQRFHLKFGTPTGLPAGSYLLAAQLDPANAFHDANPANNAIVSEGVLTIT